MLYPYIKNSQVFLCPSGGSYGNNRNVVAANNHASGVTMAAIQYPAETVVFADVTWWNCDPVTGLGGSAVYGVAMVEASRFARSLAGGCHGGGVMLARHNEMTNVAFADGHAKAMKTEATERPVNMWDLN